MKILLYPSHWKNTRYIIKLAGGLEGAGANVDLAMCSWTVPGLDDTCYSDWDTLQTTADWSE